MTPKEKAEDLIDKYYVLIHPKVNSYYQAKQCALIAVDEIIQVFWLTHNEDNLKIYSYYQQVKQEIEKL
jgi:hypothetical protein